MRKHQDQAFTLLEMIVTLTVIAVLLTAMLVSFIKRLDRIAGEKEDAALQAIATGFKEGVKRTRSVPNQTGWASLVAGQLGWQLADVTANDRGNTRIFLIDPAMQIGTNSVGGPLLPYAQPINGSTVTNGFTVVRPVNPRFMVVSTIGNALPVSLASGLGATTGVNAFTNLWATPEGSAPGGWGWSDGKDLKIKRIDLNDLFVPITLANSDTNREPTFGMDALVSGPLTYTSTTPPPMYYMRGSELKLYNASGVLEYTEILYTSQEFTFELGSWQAKPYLGRAVGNPNGKALQRAMDLFLKAPSNPYAKAGATKEQVYNAMVAYMEAFIDWREAGYPGESCPGPVSNNGYTAAVSAARVTLSTATANFIDP